MQLGMIGLGRMGANMVRRLETRRPRVRRLRHRPDGRRRARRRGHDRRDVASSTSSQQLRRHRGTCGSWSRRRSSTRRSPRWRPLLERGDTIIDGGNSWYRDDIDRAAAARRRPRHRLRRRRHERRHPRPRARLLPDDRRARPTPSSGWRRSSTRWRPGVDAADADTEPVRCAATRPSTAERGWLHCGPNGAGHFVKMVHNGIEYGLMAAYAEGLNVLAKADIGAETHAADAETAPLTDPEYYQYDLDLAAITEVWRRGSVVASWLLDLTAQALAARPAPRRLPGAASATAARGAGRSARPSTRACRCPVLSSALFAAVQLPRPRRHRRQGPVGDAGRLRRPRRAQGEQSMTHVSRAGSHPPTPSCCSGPPATSPSASCSRRCTTSCGAAS